METPDVYLYSANPTHYNAIDSFKKFILTNEKNDIDSRIIMLIIDNSTVDDTQINLLEAQDRYPNLTIYDIDHYNYKQLNNALYALTNPIDHEYD